MAILQYWCPKHHTTKRLTRLKKFTFWENNSWTDYKDIYKARFDIITPICQICREKMVYAGSNLPKKGKKGKNESKI